jgi:DNA-directed RNA polymerase subunit RPC12/RpoP
MAKNASYFCGKCRKTALHETQKDGTFKCKACGAVGRRKRDSGPQRVIPLKQEF